MVCRCLLFVALASACDTSIDLDEKTSELSGATTIVSLTFDDTLADQYQVADLVEARGMRAVFYINSPRLGTAGYLTFAQAMELQTRGHEIGGHTLGHINLPTLTTDQARDQICNDRANLLDSGFAVTTFAYPFGADNASVQQITDDCGYNYARDVGGLRSTTCTSCPWANPIPPANAMLVRTYNSIETDTTLAEMQQQVLSAEQNGGGFVPMVFHHVCNGCASNAVSPAQLAQFLDWLAARGPATQVGTMQEALGGGVQPGVRFPDTVNLAKNPSLETDADGNQVPDCWQRGGFGTNSATYTLVSDASNGVRAQQIQVTSLSSGGRRLVTAQDSGTCAPAITPGHTYSISAFYKSTTQPRITVYYRNAAGSWVWFAETPLQPTSSTYREATLTTPALPAGATHLSFGVGIFAVGTVTIDQHTLRDTAGSTATDTVVPLLATTCNGNTCSTQPYTAPVRIALAASDAGSGIDEIRYTTNGSDPTNGTLYTGELTLDATATVRATAVDNEGNRTFRTTRVTITPPPDTTPPSLAIACNGTACSTTPYPGPVTVSLTASDAGSGVREIRYTTNGSDPATGTLYTGPFSVGASATVRSTAVDNANNRTSLTTAITIGTGPDTTPPALAITCNGATCAGTYTAPVTVALAASDPSGVAEVRYTLDGSDPIAGTLYTAPFTVGATTTVRATAVDTANNRASITQPITIDTTPVTNLLQNASLEADADGNQIPDCWKRDGYGTNTAVFTLVTDAFDGVRAQKLDITAFTSGGRRLASAQDAGACAPAATAGKRYAMTGYYKSTIQPRFSVYYRNAAGSWSYLAESAPLPASSTYRHATYTSPPLPAGATHISVGLSIFGVGSITTDMFTLVEAP